MPKFQLLVNPLNVSNTSTPYRALSHLISCQALRRRLGLLRGVEVTPRAFARPLRRQGAPFTVLLLSHSSGTGSKAMHYRSEKHSVEPWATDLQIGCSHSGTNSVA